MNAITENDFGSEKYGYGGVRTYLTKTMRIRADRALLRAANNKGITKKEFKEFSESKYGRYYGDCFISKNELKACLNGGRTIDLAYGYLPEGGKA
jgi:hypothetical protein